MYALTGVQAPRTQCMEQRQQHTNNRASTTPCGHCLLLKGLQLQGFSFFVWPPAAGSTRQGARTSAPVQHNNTTHTVGGYMYTRLCVYVSGWKAQL
jgi:hypothetical protein